VYTEGRYGYSGANLWASRTHIALIKLLVEIAEMSEFVF